jgi:hypothetical protein
VLVPGAVNVGALAAPFCCIAFVRRRGMVRLSAVPAAGMGQQRCWRPACFPVWSPYGSLSELQPASAGIFIMNHDEFIIKTTDMSSKEMIDNFYTIIT